MLTFGGSIYSALEGGTGQFKVSCLFVPLRKIRVSAGNISVRLVLQDDEIFLLRQIDNENLV